MKKVIMDTMEMAIIHQVRMMQECPDRELNQLPEMFQVLEMLLKLLQEMMARNVLKS